MKIIYLEKINGRVSFPPPSVGGHNARPANSLRRKQREKGFRIKMLRFSTLFSPHAVLQRDVPLPVWGFGAEPETLVRVRIEHFEAITRSDSKGFFSVRFAPFPAGGPVSISAECGGEKITSGDVIFGDVFLAGGQSNMAFAIGSLREESKQEYLDDPAAFASVRMITVNRIADPRPRREFSGVWQSASAETLPAWSAVAAAFARRIAGETGVPVGIVNDNYGGTGAEAWLSREALIRHPRYAPVLEEYEQKLGTLEKQWIDAEDMRPPAIPETLEGQMAQCFGAPPVNRAAAENWGAPELDESDWCDCMLPAKWTAMNVNNASVVCFRKTIWIPSDWAGRDLVLELGIMEQQDITCFDGVEVGRTGKDFEYMCFTTPRVYSVPGKLVETGKHTLMIRNYCFIWDGGVNGPAGDMRIYPAGHPEEALALDGAWKLKVETREGKVPFGGVASTGMGPGNPRSFNTLFNSMIQPVLPFAMRGVVWYQGEQNTCGDPDSYAELMRRLIEDWRYRWGQGDFPFIQVLLAGYNAPKEFELNSATARIREAQREAARATGNMVVSAVDLGDAADIHPQQKRRVGERLALAGLREFFSLPVPRSPEFRRMTRQAGSLRLEFDYVEALRQPENGPVRGFVIAGETGEFHPATAKIVERNVLELSAPEVPRPCFVRYAWSDNPETTNLYDDISGLPALPFKAG